MMVFYKKQRDTPLSLILTFSARHLFCKDCMGLLAHVYDLRTCEVRLEDVPVVHGFLNIFPYKLLGLPPK